MWKSLSSLCGLAGSFRRPVDIDRLLAAVAHRGPDGCGHVTVGDAVLGHTRLAIQDTTDDAAQPFTYGATTITYNGEAWNAGAIRASLPGPWRSTGDTEAVAALLDAEGPAGLDRVNGMFALAWTGRDGTWLARDRYGKVPLYAVRRGDRWQWASELKALPYGSHAAAVRPGTAVHLETGRVTTWTTDAAPLPAEPDEVLNQLRAGVRARLVSDRPVCFLLSGGLDSSLVLALAREVHPNPVAYTAVYDPASADLHNARQVATWLDVPLVEVKVPEPDQAAVQAAVAAVEVPMKAQVEIALGCLPLAKAIASDGFRVVLSGEAADELFGGYGNMAIAASRGGDDLWRQLRRDAVAKMARGNFMRVNKVFMAAGVEARLPYMHRPLVDLTLAASKAECPPGKGLLKAAAEGLVPDRVRRRPKHTFQGGSGIAEAAARLAASPVAYYNAEARRTFGWLPKE